MRYGSFNVDRSYHPSGPPRSAAIRPASMLWRVVVDPVGCGGGHRSATRCEKRAREHHRKTHFERPAQIHTPSVCHTSAVRPHTGANAHACIERVSAKATPVPLRTIFFAL